MAPAPSTPAPALPPAATPDPLDEEPVYAELPADWDAESFCRQAAEDARRTAYVARASGDFRTASKAARDAASLANVLARLEANARNDRNVVTFTREELERGAALVKERLLAQAAELKANGGLVCCRCSEELRIEFATAPEPTRAGGAG